MYKACIFDLDGTLTDTLESLTFSVNETLKEVALPAITEEQCRTFVGNGAKVLIEQSLKAAGDTKLLLFEKAFEAYGRIFDRNCTYHVKPYPGIREMLLKLKDQNMKLGVLSNKNRIVRQFMLWKKYSGKRRLTLCGGREKVYRENRILRHCLRWQSH